MVSLNKPNNDVAMEMLDLPNYTFDQLFDYHDKYLKRTEVKREQAVKDAEAVYERECYMRDGTFDIFDDYFTTEDNLIQEWTAFGESTMDCYPEYHTASMITLLGHLFPAKMTPQYSKNGIYNNMWCIVLGNSGCGKSIGCGSAVGVAYEECISPYFSRIPNKFTPESLTQSLSEGSRRFHYSNEAVGFLKNMKRDYAGELPEDLTNAYDGERVSKQTIKMGTISCEHPLYSAIWNTTIDSWAKNASEDGFTSGMLLRPFYVISTRERKLKMDCAMNDTQTKMRAKFIANLLELLELVHGKVVEGIIPHPRVIVFEESTYLNDWKFGLREDSNRGKYTNIEQSALQRVFDQSRKLAMNLTISSKWFRDYVKAQNKKEAPTEGALQSVNNELACNIPDEIAEVACHVAEMMFWKNSVKALKATYTTGVYDKILRAFDGTDKKLSKSELGSIACITGERLTEVLRDLGLEHQKMHVPGSCRPVDYYWVPNK